MAVRWRCPSCGEAAIEADPLGILDGIVCSSCETSFAREAALCFVCDSPDALRRRDSIHVQCRVCGESQMMFMEIRAAV